MASLKNQIINAIESGFGGGGHKKRADKFNRDVNTKERVYSYSEKENLMKTSVQLTNFIKENYPGVKLIKEISENMVRDFIISKVDVCRQSTLDQYRSRLDKIEHLINVRYKTADVSFGNLKIASALGEDKLRCSDMDKVHYKAIMDSSLGSNSKGRLGVEIAREWALRVSEVTNIRVKDINLEEKILHIHQSKGGRSRDLPIREYQMQMVEKMILNREDNDRVVTIKEDSINRWLGRELEKNGIRDYNAEKTGVHCIRKMVAQEKYDEFRNEGYTRAEARDLTSEYLGHGEDREELMKEYVANMW
ncbi:MAG: tyrosine-type recombinase/integrase [Peptostreptococcaceae bacterium]